MSESLNSDQQQQLLFMMLLQQHEQIAMMGMGKIKSPVTEKIERDLKSAKYAIDTLVMLEKFTKGNLSKELSGYLTQMLTNLRMNFADEKKKESVGGAKKEESPKTDGGSSANGDSSGEGSSKNGGASKAGGSAKKEEGQKKSNASKNARPDTSGEDSSGEGSSGGDSSKKEDK